MNRTKTFYFICFVLCLSCLFVSHNINLAETDPEQWSIFRGDIGLSGYVKHIPQKFNSLWDFKTSNPIESGMVIGSVFLYFANIEGTLFALNEQTGEKIWERKSEAGFVAAPLVIAEKEKSYLLVGDQDGVFYGIDALTGKEIWRFSCNGKITSSASYFRHNNELFVVFGSYDFKFYCLNAANGEKLWIVETENFINGTPALSDTTLVFGGCDSFLRIIELSTGELRHSVNLKSYLPSSPVLIGNISWVANYSGSVFSVDVATGNIIWEYHDENNGAFVAPLAVNQSFVIAAAQQGSVHVIERATGKRKYVLEVNGRISSGPIIDDNNLLIADESGYLTLFDLQSGQEIMRYEHGPAIVSPVAVYANRIYVGDDNGNLTVYQNNKD